MKYSSFETFTKLDIGFIITELDKRERYVEIYSQNKSFDLWTKSQISAHVQEKPHLEGTEICRGQMMQSTSSDDDKAMIK